MRSILFAIGNLVFYSGMLIWTGHLWGSGASGSVWILNGIVWAIWVLLAILGFVARIVIAVIGASKNPGARSSSASENYVWGRRRRR